MDWNVVTDIVLRLGAITVAFTGILMIVAYTVLAERRVLGFIQGRLGSEPRRAGRTVPAVRRPPQVHLQRGARPGQVDEVRLLPGARCIAIAWR